jgi:protein-S-isoprenylcysteine O-methyltransferase Ste14
MMVPGLIAIAFYRRWPSRAQILIGAVATVLACAVLGYVLPPGSLGRLGSVSLAIVGGLLLYFAILAFFYVRIQNRSKDRPAPGPPT